MRRKVTMLMVSALLIVLPLIASCGGGGGSSGGDTGDNGGSGGTGGTGQTLYWDQGKWDESDWN